MKKTLYLLAFLMLSFSFVVGCKEKEDEPDPIDDPNNPTTETTNDSLSGTWYSYEGVIYGTNPTTPIYTNSFPIMTHDTLTLTTSAISQKWWVPSPTTSFPHVIKRGTYSISGRTITNAFTSKTQWTVPGDIPEEFTISESNTYNFEFKTTKDTLILTMNSAAAITANSYGAVMTYYSGMNTSNPVMKLKFKRKP